MRKSLIKKMIGGKIADISRTCDLISIQINTRKHGNLFLHIQSFVRIINNKRIIVSSEDMYKCGSNCNLVDFNWDVPGESLFDDSLKKHTNLIFNSVIIQVRKNQNDDLYIKLENGCLIQISINTSEFEEKYRIFNDEEEFIVSS